MTILCLQDFSGCYGRLTMDSQLVSEGNTSRTESEGCSGKKVSNSGLSLGQQGSFVEKPCYFHFAQVSRWLIRSSSAQTSAMRPDITIRPAQEGLTAESNSRTTRNWRRRDGLARGFADGIRTAVAGHGTAAASGVKGSTICCALVEVRSAFVTLWAGTNHAASD